MTFPQTYIDRYWSKVVVGDGCWGWQDKPYLRKDEDDQYPTLEDFDHPSTEHGEWARRKR